MPQFLDFSNSSISAAGILDAVEVREPFRARYQGYLEEEVSRYPMAVRGEMPEFIMAASGSVDGRPLRARFLPGKGLIALTPRYDFRGNVHRCLAEWLLGSGDDGDGLRELWSKAHAGPAKLLYPAEVLTPERQLFALMGALVSGRTTLTRPVVASLGLTEVVQAIDEFLLRKGIARDGAALAAPEPHGYNLSVDSNGDELVVLPGNVKVTLRPPDDEGGHSFVALPSTELERVRIGTVIDTWLLPEYVLGSAVSVVHVVRDVSAPACDIAGFARGRKGAASQIVTELEHRRTIFAHELGHALHARFHDDFPEAAWMALVPPDPGYFGDAQQFIRSGLREPDFSHRLLRNGFVTSYGSSTLQEDVAEYFEMALTGDQRLWAAAETSELVAAKVALLIEFLRDAVDPAFSNDYFMNVAQLRSQQERLWGL